jgi:hypothetical protein
MSASFRRIDYSLHPAKHAERRMLCEIFRRLWPFQPIDEYVYVGFGSVWFADFVLFHRVLGIRNMISIEKSAGARERFKANMPFGNITMDFRESSVALPSLDWDQKYFLWLDYDDPLLESMLLDVSTVAMHAPSGTLLAVSLQCQQAREVQEASGEPKGASAMTRFRDRFGRDRVPSDVFEDDLYGWPFGGVSRRMLASEIRSALAVRNAVIPEERRIVFHHVCDIEYEDGAKMTTAVGLFVANSDAGRVAECGFDRLDFMHHGTAVRRIRVPKLTIREIRSLERQLPQPNLDDLALGAIPRAEAEAFAEIYRYLPNFAVMES